MPSVPPQGFSQPGRPTGRSLTMAVPHSHRTACLATVCSVGAIHLGPRDDLLAHLAAQRESRFDVELGVNERIER